LVDVRKFVDGGVERDGVQRGAGSSLGSNRGRQFDHDAVRLEV
jgi:hypothetical protein